MTTSDVRLPLLAGIIILVAGIWISGHYTMYEVWPRYDDMMHALGGVVAAWFIAAFLARDIKKLPRPTAVLLIVGATAIVGILWEAAEFLSGKYMKDIAPVVWSYFRGGNLQDTIGDLGLDLGGSLALALFWIRTKRS